MSAIEDHVDELVIRSHMLFAHVLVHLLDAKQDDEHNDDRDNDDHEIIVSEHGDRDASPH